MSKKSDPRRQSQKARRQPLLVTAADGTRQRFLRGMLTHDLIQRGLGFDESYAVARAIRDRLAERVEVSTAELRDLVQEQLVSTFGEQAAAFAESSSSEPERFVIYQDEKHPFSRGLLARSIHAAGPDLDRAYRLVTELEGELAADQVTVASSDEIARRVGDLLERWEGAETARRYRLVRRIRSLPRPLVIYLGGSSGTGKSTLALELAPLLRIYRINATDTIRQVMRMVFSPQMLPALYNSSFEVAPPLGVVEERRGLPHEPEFKEKVLRSFEEQATRIAVGLRAVVERATAENMNVLIEGVHLYPPLVPFGDLEGAVYQVPMVLMTPDKETHRSRFLGRARLSSRRAERYLENFPAIRAIQDFLVEQAETHEVPLVETSTSDPPVGQALRVVTGLLQKRLPGLADASWRQRTHLTPALLLIIDGLADRPVRALGGRTPLQAAETPHLDRLAAAGQCGLADPIAPGVVGDTAAGCLALFGQSPAAMKRGPIEALGAGIELRAGDIALRGNFATLDDSGRVIDRRAGRIREGTVELAQALDRMPLAQDGFDDIEVRVRAATEHRLAIVLRGEGLSSAVVGSDPGDGAPSGPPLTPQPIDPADERGVFTARLLALFEQRARRLLARHPVNLDRQARNLAPANALLTRGAGRVHRLVQLEVGGVPLQLTCISGDRTILGMARWLGAETLCDERMTANLDTDLSAKLTLASKALGRSDLVVVHVKGADIAAHDQRPELKAAFLEKVDKSLGEFLANSPRPLRIAVAGDHATLSESGQHGADPLPVLLWGEGIEADEVRSYDEFAAAAGALARFPLQMLVGRIFDLG